MQSLLALVDDPDLQRLPARAFRLLVNLMGLSQVGPLPDRSRLAWRLHLTAPSLDRDLAPLVAAGRVVADGDRITLVTERVEPVSAIAPSPTAAPGPDAGAGDQVASAAGTASAAGSRARTRAWRARRRADKEGQGRLALFSVVTSPAPRDVTGDGVTRHSVTERHTASPHDRNQHVRSVTPGVTGVTPSESLSLSHRTPSRQTQTQTLARERDGVTVGDASPASPPQGSRIDIAAARAAFDRFRDAYPKPPSMDPRRPAEEEFLRLVLREQVDPERIVGALAPFAEQIRRDRIEPRFVPGSARWLRERRFEDIAPAAIPPPRADTCDPWLTPVLERLAADLGGDVTAAWFSRLEVLRRGTDAVVLEAPSRIAAARIEEQYRDRLRAAVATVHGPLRVTVTAAGEAPRHARAPP